MRTISFLAAATLLTTFLPAQLKPCVFTPIRPTCGPILAGLDRILTTNRTQYHVITFKAGNAPAGAIGVLAFGLKQIHVRFPGTRCFLLTDVRPSWAIPFHTDRQGTASATFRVAGKLSGIVYAQSAFVKSKQLTTSNALKITCR